MMPGMQQPGMMGMPMQPGMQGMIPGMQQPGMQGMMPGMQQPGMMGMPMQPGMQGRPDAIYGIIINVNSRDAADGPNTDADADADGNATRYAR